MRTAATTTGTTPQHPDRREDPPVPRGGRCRRTALHNAFQADNGCYTIEDTTGNTVVNPKGHPFTDRQLGLRLQILRANPHPAGLYCRTQPELAAQLLGHRHGQRQLLHYHLPDYLPRGKVEAIDDTFTIEKTAAPSSINTLWRPVG